MKQRVLSFVVLENGNELFSKKPATPQDVIYSLALFERDNLQVIIDIDVLDITPQSQTKD